MFSRICEDLARPHITGFRLYRGRGWILSLEPVIEAAGTSVHHTPS
jgi:hypothetical protein